MKLSAIGVVVVLLWSAVSSAEVTKVTIASKTTVANGQAFGAAGAYEKLTGTIEFAIDPANPHNKTIADLQYATRMTDGRVRFTSDLHVLRPVDASKGNGVLLFEVANRGNKLIFGYFNAVRGQNANDPQAPADFGDGFLMREGYTLVWVGWQFDVAPPRLRVEAPLADLRRAPSIDPVKFSFILDSAAPEAAPADWPRYLPIVPDDPSATLTVRDKWWDAPTPLPRRSWRFVPANGRPRLALDSGFEPGRVYEVTYRAQGAVVAGVGLAALRDAGSAFVHRDDLAVHGRSAYIFGASQSGRLLRQFLHDGFNLDERNRKVFDFVWPHIAGAGMGSFNERFAMPGYSSYPATRMPYDYDGILAPYQSAQTPKIIATNTPVEYWGQGRAAAMTHATLDGRMDARIPENIRIYLLAGTQHGEAPFPPPTGGGQQLSNPTPQVAVMHALLRAGHRWVAQGTKPPDSRYPRLNDGSLVAASASRFPAIPGVGDPRTIEGPTAPFLVPNVDADGNDAAGIRVPEVAVPLATATGWNFRAPRVGNSRTLYALLGSYIPFATTRAERQATQDPRLSIEERYGSRDEYVQKIRGAAAELIKGGYLLQEDMDNLVARANAHWDTRIAAARSRRIADSAHLRELAVDQPAQAVSLVGRH